MVRQYVLFLLSYSRIRCTVLSPRGVSDFMDWQCGILVVLGADLYNHSLCRSGTLPLCRKALFIAEFRAGAARNLFELKIPSGSDTSGKRVATACGKSSQLTVLFRRRREATRADSSAVRAMSGARIKH